MTFMFTKGLFSSVKNKGKQILQNALKAKTQKVAAKVAKPPSLKKSYVGYQPVQIPSRLHQIWRGLVPRVYYNSLAAQLGRQAALKAGKNAPLLAFFGLVVSQNIDQNEDELSFRIQNFIKTASSGDQALLDSAQQLSLENFEFGSRIGQGCNAAVYEARLRKAHQVDAEEKATDDSSSEVSILTNGHEEPSEVEPVIESVIVNDSTEVANEIIETGDNDQQFALKDSGSFHGNIFFESSDSESDMDSDITVISWESDEEFLRDEGALLMFSVNRDNNEDAAEFPIVKTETSDDEFEIIQEEMEDSMSVLQRSMTSFTEVLHNFQRNNDSQEGLKDEGSTGPALSLEIGTSSLTLSGSQELDNDRHGIDDETDKIESNQSMNSSIIQDDGRTRPKLKYDLAVKMMFNYDIESNASAIMRSMQKETLPARISTLHERSDIRKNRNQERKKALPPHPNIVEMWGVFVDPVPALPDGLRSYPAALPSRINPDGIGRNMTMFIVMKRYDMTLGEYLSLYNPDLTFRERILLLAQLLEAVDHLNKNGIAHRDMKADNLLLDLSSEDVPHLVVSDFGCCLANSNHGLMLPYPSDEVDKGGNTALMAPEIVCTEPGPYVKLDYRKADLWSVGAIAYEILGADNPFYTSTQGRLDSYSYTEHELPPQPEGCPQAIEESLFALLSKDQRKRPSAREVLNIIYAYLWLPSDWLNTSTKVKVTRPEVMWWVVTMATDVILKQKCLNTDSVELTLKTLFIKNFKFGMFRRALDEYNIFIQA